MSEYWIKSKKILNKFYSAIKIQIYLKLKMNIVYYLEQVCAIGQ